jgi:hypothetical protein
MSTLKSIEHSVKGMAHSVKLKVSLVVRSGGKGEWKKSLVRGINKNLEFDEIFLFD